MKRFLLFLLLATSDTREQRIQKVCDYRTKLNSLSKQVEKDSAEFRLIVELSMSACREGFDAGVQWDKEQRQ